MNKRIQGIGLLALACLVTLGLSAWTQEESAAAEQRLVTVTGDAEVRVVPDEVILTLGVETWNKDLGTAKRANDAIVSRILALVADHGIAPEHAKTDYVGIQPRYRYGTYEERDFIGYFVHKTIVITLRDLSEFESLLADALEAGANYVHGIQFRTTDLRKYRDEARSMAVRAAEEKAVALAKELGQTVGEPLTLLEVQNDWATSYGSWWGSGWTGAASQNVIQETGIGAWLGEGSVAPGQISVRARVSVSFALEQ
jgi:uncharacterized protein